MRFLEGKLSLGDVSELKEFECHSFTLKYMLHIVMHVSTNKQKKTTGVQQGITLKLQHRTKTQNCCIKILGRNP